MWSGVQSPGAAPGEYNLLSALLLECLVLPGGGVVLSHQVLHQVVHSDNLPAPLKPVIKFALNEIYSPLRSDNSHNTDG